MNWQLAIGLWPLAFGSWFGFVVFFTGSFFSLDVVGFRFFDHLITRSPMIRSPDLPIFFLPVEPFSIHL